MVTSVLEPPETTSGLNMAAAERLRKAMAATRVSFTWFGVRKSLSAAQKERAADSFDAQASFLSAAKKLLDTQHSAYRAVTAVKGQVVQYWRSLTLPYPEPGLRLIRQRDLSDFHDRLGQFRRDLDTAVSDLDEQYAELRNSARSRLGALYNAADYPPSLRDEFGMAWEFPSIDPPHYLRQLDPQLYADECLRVQARFAEAVQLAEQAFVEEFARLMQHLTERLSGSADGKPKVFRDSAIENCTEFFERFRRLNIGSSSQLDDLVAEAQDALRGVAPQALRDQASIRQRVAQELAPVQQALDGLMQERPRRSILRPSRAEAR